MQTQRYQDQHRELLALAGKLAGMLDPAKLGQDAEPARKCLGEMAGKLNVHLAMEDQVLYPALLKGPAQSADLAKRFMEEMGGIKQAFGAYLATWPGAGAIQKDPSGFVTQTQGILGALGKRIEVEEGQLYPAAEKLG